MTVLAGQYQGLAAATAHGGSLVKVEREAPGLAPWGGGRPGLPGAGDVPAAALQLAQPAAGP